MELTANELRIGNLLTTTAGRIIGQRDIVKVDVNHINHINQGNEFNYEPIPLTEEWLEKFGFNKWTMGVESFFKNGFTIYKSEIVFFELSFHDRRLTRIQYVHQLQNLYFALVGEELTIKELV